MSPEFSKPLDKLLKKEMNKMANEIKKNVPATVEDILAQFTVEEIEKMLAAKRAPAEGSPLKVGNRVAIQTVTYHWVGKIVEITPREIILTDGAWVADFGKFNASLTSGKLGEYEEVPGVFSIERQVVCASFLWNFPLPSKK